MAPTTTDVAVIGGGIVGLATARELASRDPSRRVVVLEREAEVGRHQTGRNSGVVHAGIYYKPGSLKARLCVEGAREMYAFCEARGIAHERCGKLIVALSEAELPRLDELERRGRANGVPRLERIDAAGIERVEPHARGVAALYSPASGIADFPAVARALAEDAQVVTGCEVTGFERCARGVRVRHRDGALEARRAVVCAGAWADRLAVAAGGD